MIMSISLWHSGEMQGINGGLPPALSEAIVQPSVGKKSATRHEDGAREHQDVRERGLHNATTGQCRPTRRFENKESRAGEWESEVEVASTMFQIPQRSLA
jgi:hypothetical protein